MVGVAGVYLIYAGNLKFRFRISIFSLLFVFICGINVYSQDRCGTVEYIKVLRDRNLLREGDQKFEQWLNRNMPDGKARLSTLADTYKIPVVVHVIHNGEAIGVGANLSENQILSQIKVLNNDFNRLNADTVKTPSEFLSVAGNINIEFILAKQTPQGVATNGIVRVKGTKSQWSVNDDTALKALSYWPAEDYLNIWVTDIASSILGYAQFPVSNLAGLEDTDDNRLTDGVVLDYRIVGSNDDGAFNLTTNFNKGRTATHEVGHFFGLRHIWGDDDGLCSGDGDYVNDTPDQGNSTNGCPAHPQTSCNAHTMFQNYMDYTNDVCMNLYTVQQISRMVTVLENSPRRASLLSSNGSYDPAPVNNDLGITDIQSPTASECIGTLVPRIVLKNNGANKVTSANLQLSVNTGIVETKDVTISLEPLQTAEISFSPLTLSSGSNVIRFEILKTNQVGDGKLNDNQKSITTVVPESIIVPFTENFSSMPSAWSVKNADEETTWTIAETAQINNSANNAIYMNFFQEDFSDEEKDILTTPVMDLTQATSPFLAFDVAYAKYQNNSDGLEVRVLLNCNNDITQGTLVYSKFGSSLATAPATNLSFSPTGEDQWRKEVIDLSDFAGQANVQLAFVAVNDNGNNLYLDNVAFRGDVSENIAIKKITHPSPVHCSREVQPSLLVENKSNVPITSFKIRYALNNGTVQTTTVGGSFNLASGEQTTITTPSMTLTEGENSLSFEIIEPNSFVDIDPSDNAMSIKSIVNDTADKIPLRENFDNGSEDQWQIVNPTGSRKWTEASTNFNQSLYFDGYSQSDTTTEEYSWFVSPTLDFSDATMASLFFDLSFRVRNMDSVKDSNEAVFQVLASRDCGNIFNEILFSSNETSLSDGSSDAAWHPSGTSDWRSNYINLNAFAGQENIRIAFVLANRVSNNLYLDNIEFFVSDNPSPVIPSELYVLYGNEIEQTKSFYISFNLSNRQNVKYELIDMVGKQVGSNVLTDVLNQTFEVDVENASHGIYLVRLLIDNKFYVSRIFVGQ